MSWLLFFLPLSTYSLHFYLKEGTDKCFIVDIPEKTVVVGDYELMDPPPKDAVDKGVKLRVNEPNGTMVLDRLVMGEGRFSFTSQVPGAHKVCVQTVASGWFASDGRVRFALGIDQSHDDIEHGDLASVEQLNGLQLLSHNIIERLKEIAKDQEYNRQKEAAFKDESEDINGRIIWFSIFQTLIILVAGIWQILSLRNFFIAKRLF